MKEAEFPGGFPTNDVSQKLLVEPVKKARRSAHNGIFKNITTRTSVLPQAPPQEPRAGVVADRA